MRPGKIALLRFPRADLERGKLRPVLLIAQVPGPHADWLVAMVSTRLDQAVSDLDEVITESDEEFPASGLKKASVIRAGRLAVVDAELLDGEIGEIPSRMLERIRDRITSWILGG